MKKLKVMKKKVMPSDVPQVSVPSGLFTPMIPVISLPFIMMRVFTESLNSLFGLAAREAATTKNEKVREMPNYKARVRPRAA